MLCILLQVVELVGRNPSLMTCEWSDVVCILLQVVQLVGWNPSLMTCGWSDVVYIVTGCTAGW